MSLFEKIKKAIKMEEYPTKTYLASATLMGTAKLADVITTKVGVDQLGTYIEANPLTKYCMDNLGTDLGLFALSFPVVAHCAIAGALLNLAGRKGGKLEKNAGNLFMAGLSAIPIYDAIRNAYILHQAGLI